MHQGHVSVYVKNADLISLSNSISSIYMKHEGKTIKTDGHKVMLNALKLIGICGRDESSKLSIQHT